jgi:hypothetical protein
MPGEYISDQPNDFEQWKAERDAAREATGGILIESTTDAPEDVITANLFQPHITYEQTVTVSHPVRPSEPGGPTDGEMFTEEHYGAARDGAELRSDTARFLKNLAAARKANPNFDRETEGAEDQLVSEAARRSILKCENSGEVYHFLALSPMLTASLAAMHPHRQAVFVRQISRDLAEGAALPPDSSYSQWATRRNQYIARRRHGRNG